MKSDVVVGGGWRQEVVMMEIEHQVFAANEIDFDYEFDAARFFDLSAQETPVQTRQAELWFETAGSYAPSPFVANLVLREEDVSANTVHDPKPSVFQHYDSKAVRATGNVSGFHGGVVQNVAVQPGMTFSSKTIHDGMTSKAKSVVRKGSTLMKPTASQLAKQNRPPQVVGSRFQKVQTHKKETNFSNSSGIESQAAKRQKLEGGLLRKVDDVKQQPNYVHKAPKKVVTVDQNSGYSKLKITIPREPGLETAHRTQRIRPKNAAEEEHVVAAPRFKARPLNRKILNAPSLALPKRSTPRLPDFHEFHFKTSERAMQHTSATSSSTLPCDDSVKDWGKHANDLAPENRITDLKRPSVMDTPKRDRLDSAHNFKARPLNKKILSSKGDIGVFRNIKQETTVPVEFNFHTEKRVQHNPPIDLLSKLSLTSEVQSNNESKSKLPLHFSMFRKDSKENIGFHPNQKVHGITDIYEMVYINRIEAYTVLSLIKCTGLKEKPFLFGAKQIHSGSDGSISQAGTPSNARRRYA